MATVTDVYRDLVRTDTEFVQELVPDAHREIRDLHLLDDLHQARDTPAGVLILLTASASRQAEGYELDVALRRLPQPAGLIIQNDCRRPSTTGIPLARRLEVPILWLRGEADVGSLFRRIGRLIHDETTALLERTEDLLELLDDADHRGEDVVRALLEHDPFEFSVGEEDAELVGVPLVLTDEQTPWLHRSRSSRFEDLIARLVGWRVAAAMTLHDVQRDRADQLTLHSVGALLDQILSEPDEEELQRLLRQARTFGLPIDGWHEAVRLDLADLLVLCDNDPVVAYERTEVVSRLAVQTARRTGGTWNMVIRPSGCLMFRTRGRPRTPKDAREILQQMTTVIEEIRERVPDLAVYCGIGTSHEGSVGLAPAQAEADSAVQLARLRGTANRPVIFDAPGIRRLLLEWYSSTTVRQSIEELLAPLDDLGKSQKRREYIQTLRVYLDTNRSIARSAEQLFVHRNTVVYRIKRILELLEVDLDDPHQALSLHLACHAELGLHPSFQD